jgi:hypothetical protein
MIAAAFAFIAKWLTGSTLDRILSSVDHKVDNETERERVRAGIVEEYAKAQVALLSGRGWWFPLFFIVPLGLWFASVCLYSVLFCAGCAFPQSWSIAALPKPLDEWAGAIVGSLFLAKGVGEVVARWRR